MAAPKTPRPSELRKLLLQELRSRRTCAAMSRAMGFTFNQYYRWETGSKRITWQEFTEILSFKKIDLDHSLREVFGILPGTLSGRMPTEKSHGARILSQILRTRFGGDKRRFAARLNAPAWRVRRWLRGATEVPLDSVLSLLSSDPVLLLQLISSLIPLRKAPRLHAAVRSLQHSQARESQIAFSSAVLAQITAEGSKNLEWSIGNATRQLRLSPDQIRLALDYLITAGLIRIENGSYRAQVAHRDQRPSAEALSRIYRYWAYRSACAIAARPAKPKASLNSQAGYLVFAMSDAKAREIADMINEFYAKLFFSLSEDQDEASAVRVITFSFFDLADSVPVSLECHPDLGLVEKSKSQRPISVRR